MSRDIDKSREHLHLGQPHTFSDAVTTHKCEQSSEQDVPLRIEHRVGVRRPVRTLPPYGGRLERPKYLAHQVATTRGRGTMYIVHCTICTCTLYTCTMYPLVVESYRYIRTRTLVHSTMYLYLVRVPCMLVCTSYEYIQYKKVRVQSTGYRVRCTY